MLNEAITLRLKRATGLDLSPAAVSGAVKRRMKDCAMPDREFYAHRVLHDDDELHALIDQVVVPESWFFRDGEAFAAAVAFVRTRLAETQYRRPLRLLCIPCASGEEPGSLAMALLDAGIGAQHFTIEAVDVSRESIERVRHGVYHRNAFRTADLAFRERHFMKNRQSYVLNATVRAQIHSYCGNLLTLENPPVDNAFDLIFCRNLLIYFDEATQRAAIRKLDALLGEGGLLLVGYAEAATFCRQGFAMAEFPKAFALQRRLATEVAVRTEREPRPTRRPKPQPVSVPKAAATVRPAKRTPVPAPAAEPAEPSDALLHQAKILADAGQTDDACAKYLAYLQIVPDCAEAYFMLGLLNERTDASGKASDYLRRAVYLDPRHYEALCHLALLTERDGNAREAALFRQRAARVFERGPDREQVNK